MSFADADALLWLDGDLVPAADAKLAVLDHVITVGDGAFEAIKVVNGSAFALRRHLDRFERSIAALELPPLNRGLVEAAAGAVLAANHDLLADSTHSVLRLTYTGGTGPIGSGRADLVCPRLLAAVTYHDPPVAAASVITVAWPRNERGALAGVKSTSYVENVLALAHARAAGAIEALFPNTRGMLCEGTGSNVFVVIGGEALTPPLSDGPLAGVTRQLVLEWTGAEAESLPMNALVQADEVFITSTAKDVMAVTRIDGHVVGDGTIGAVTRATAEAFAAGQARGLEP